MGKILKFCSSCDEGFAEKFTFCPDCGAPLQAFEMNPVQTEQPVQKAAVPEPPSFEAATPVEPETPAFIAEPVKEEIPVREPAPTVDDIAFASAPTAEVPVIGDVPADPEPVKADTAAAAPVDINNEISTAASADNGRKQAFMTPGGFLFEAEPRYADEVRHSIPSPLLSKDGDGYAITVIEEKNGAQRNWLLLGSLIFMVTVALGAWGISLFQKSLDVGAIGDEGSIALLLDDVPMPTDEMEEKKDKDKGGGGGGGGREDKRETSQGDLADQSKTPTRPPDVNTPRMENPSLVLPPPQTEGNRKFDKLYDKWGDPNSKFTGFSNGPGTGGGQGTGQGTGQGSGNGTGQGSGSGSGSGGGNGNGNGDGNGDGDGAPPAAVAKVTQPLRILSKQKAQYTDEARKNNVQGTVTLRVTFNANGSIGGITTIKGLPYGLTEQAIAAARAIRFEPEMVNGSARTTSRPVSFSFNIY